MIKDWRNHQRRQVRRSEKDRSVSILVPDAEGNLIRYYWGCQFGTGNGPDGWSRFIDRLFQRRATLDPRLRVDISSMSLLEDCQHGEARLLIDPYADSWKWGRARTAYHGSLAYMVRTAIASGLVSDSDPVGFGCWANGKTYEHIGRAADVARGVSLEDPLLLYHGTSTRRWVEIQEEGEFTLSRKGGVYFSGSAHRAEYFAGERTRLDRKSLPKAQKDTVQPVVLKVEMWPPLFDALRADEDWLGVRKHETGVAPDASDWRGSLADFGQVRCVEVLPADIVVDELHEVSRDRLKASETEP